MKRLGIGAALAVAGLFGFMSATAQAATYTINNTDSGYISSGGNFTGIRPNTNYVVGLCDASDCRSAPGQYRDFFYFQIPTLTQPIVSATLVIPTQSTSLDQSPTLTYQVTSLGLTPSQLGNGTNQSQQLTPSQLAATYPSLGTGVVYGRETYSSADAYTTERISLDAAAISALGDGGFLFGVSGRAISPINFSNTAPDQLVFGYSQRSVTSLVLTTAVPEPSTWAMMLIGFAGLGFAAYRQKKAAAPAVA
jgi:hypothetical protein